jgi:undecaprenyl-diphosphatase
VTPSAPPGFTISEPREPAYARSPVTTIRLLGALAMLGVTALALQAASGDFTSSFGETLASAPEWLVSGIVSACQIGFLVPAFLGLIGLFYLRRFERIGRMLAASVLCALGLFGLSALVGSTLLPLLPTELATIVAPPAGALVARTDYGIGAAFPTVLDLGVIATWMFIDRVHWSTRWRWIGRLVLALGVVAILGVNLVDPTVIIATIAMAAAAAALTQVVLGVPNTRPRAAAVGHTLEALGHHVTSVERFGGFLGFVGFRVGLAGGRRLFVKIVSRDSWAALLPVRIYRAVRYRDPGHDRPFRTLRSLVEHEALCALKTHADGVPTPRLVVVSEFPPDSMLTAFDSRPLRTLTALDPQQRTPELFASVWAIVRGLQENHTVHRRLNGDSLRVDDDGRVVLVEFTAASLGVVGPSMSTDVAEALACTAAMVGPEKAVEYAIAGVGAATVATALPRLQPLALTPATRSAVHEAGCLDALREAVQRATGSEAASIEELERVKPRTVLSIAMAAIAIGTLIPQFLGIGSLWSEIRSAGLWWAAAALGWSVVTYIGAAVAFDGSVTERLPLGPNMAVQVATSYVGVAAPGGGLALAGRFLQKRGVDGATAVAAVGVDTLAGVIVHITLTGLFLALAGSSGIRTFDLPSLIVIGAIAAGIALLALIGVAVPWSRALLTRRVLPATKRSLSSVRDIARQPGKMVELFGGSLTITMGYILALAVSVSAFGPGPAFTSVALVYLVGWIIASVAPTPGGIGAVEATLIAGLTSAGMPSTTAAAAVVLFRLTTFWIPLVPGWAAFVILQRNGDV